MAEWKFLLENHDCKFALEIAVDPSVPDSGLATLELDGLGSPVTVTVFGAAPSQPVRQDHAPGRNSTAVPLTKPCKWI